VQNREELVALPWMHLPGQLSVGWRGVGESSLDFTPSAFSCRWQRSGRDALGMSRSPRAGGSLQACSARALRWRCHIFLDGFDRPRPLGGHAFSNPRHIVSRNLRDGDSGNQSRIGDRIFQCRVIAAILAGGFLLVMLELIPYLGFLVMILAGSWAIGAALWSGMDSAGHRPPKTRRRLPFTHKFPKKRKNRFARSRRPLVGHLGNIGQVMAFERSCRIIHEQRCAVSAPNCEATTSKAGRSASGRDFVLCASLETK